MVDITALSPPLPGQICSISNDVLWCRMPLPLALDHINVYLVRDNGGWVIIDCGMATKATKAAWTTIIEQLDGPITRVIVTHMHPDHIGCAGYLTELFQVDLYMSQTEYYAARALIAGVQGADNWQDRQYYRQAGFNAEQVKLFTQGNSGLNKVVSPMPLSFHRLLPDTHLIIGEYRWKLLLGLGHSPEHISLYCEALKICIGGDQVLPKITPNIGAYSTQPHSNPLHYYFETLHTFAALPSSVLLLPSHKTPIYDIPSRVEEIRAHHYVHLNNLLQACEQPQTVVDLLPVLFHRELGQHELFFAVAECIAHLNYLIDKGQLEKTLDINQINQYRVKNSLIN